MNRTGWVALIVILIVGAWLRTNSLDQVPPGLYHDEAYSGLDALGVVQGAGFPIFFEGNGGREPFFIYLHALSIALFGISPFSLRLPAAFVGIVTLAVFFSLVRAMTAQYPLVPLIKGRMKGGIVLPRFSLEKGDALALIATAGLAVSYWHLNFSRVGWRTISLPLFACLAFYCFWRARRTNAIRDHMLTGAFLGAGLYTYLSARFLPAVLVLFWAVEAGGMIRARSNLRSWLSRIAIVVGAALVVFLPLAIYFAQNPNAFLFRVSDVTLPTEASPANALWDNAQRVAGMFYSVGDPEWRHGIARRPLLDWVIGLPFTIGLAIAVWRRKPEHTFALLWLGVMLLPTVLSRDAPDTQRAIGALPAIFLFVAWGAQAIVDLFEARMRVAQAAASAAMAAIMLFAGGTITARDYFVVWANDRHAYDDFQGNLADFARWVNQQPGNVFMPMELFAEPTVNLLITSSSRTLRSATQVTEAEMQKLASQAAVAVVSPDFPRGNPVLIRDDAVVLLDEPITVDAISPAPWRDKLGRTFAKVASVPNANSLLSTKPASYQLLAADFDHHIELVGYDITRNIAPGKLNDVRLFWSTRTPIQQEVSLFVHLLDVRGEVVAGANDYPANGLRMNLWQPGTIVPDLHQLAIDAALAPGKYSIELGFYRPSNDSRLPVWVEGRRQPDDRVLLAPFKVAVKADPAIQPQAVLNARFGDAVALSGYTVEAGSPLRVRLFWSALRFIDRDYTVFVHVLDGSGKIVAQADQQPLAGTYPTSIWDANEKVQDEVTIQMPSDIAAGAYKLEIGMYDSETQKRLPLTSATNTADAIVVPLELKPGSK